MSLSYRGSTFDERAVKSHLLPDLKTQIDYGNIVYWPETRPIEIAPGHVLMEWMKTGEQFECAADFVLLSTGFSADTTLFELAGVSLIGDQRAPEFNSETMETNVPGIYVAGTSAAGSQSRYRPLPYSW